MDTLFCPKCGLTGDDLGTCGNDIIGCPGPVPVVADKVALLKCGPCGKTLAITASDIMRGKGANLVGCTKQGCTATIMLPPAKEVVRTEVREVEKPLEPGSVVFTRDEKEQLDAALDRALENQEAADRLAKLEAAGVDNWEGYSAAFRGEDE